MQTADLRQLIVRRTLQAVIIGSSVVFLVILLALIQSSLIWLPCNDGCPPRYDEFVEAMGYQSGFSATGNFFDFFFYLLVAGITVTGLGIFRWLTSRLRQDLMAEVLNQDQQQRIALQAAIQQSERVLVISDDGELVPDQAKSEALLKKASGAIFHRQDVQALIKLGTGWFLRDVWFALHIASIIGCAIYVIVWYFGFPTDSWAAVGAGWESLVGLVPGIMLGIGLFFHYPIWRDHRANRDSELETIIQKMDQAIANWLTKAGLSEISIENLLAEAHQQDKTSDDGSRQEAAAENFDYPEEKPKPTIAGGIKSSQF